VEQYLFPARESSRLGMQLGFRPHALTGMCADSAAAPKRTPLLNPLSTLDAGVLSRSEFLLPLHDDTFALYARVLASLTPRGYL